MPDKGFQAARIVAGTLTLLSREISEIGQPVSLWSPPLSPDFIRAIAAEVSQGKADALWVDERHPAKGLAIFQPLPWESDFFGFSCARLLGPFMVAENQSDREVRVAGLSRQAIFLGRAKGVKLLTIKTFHDPAVLRGFLAEGFILAEIGAALIAAIPKEKKIDEPAIPPGFVFLDGPELESVKSEALSAGDFLYEGYFHRDPAPGSGAAKRLWAAVTAEDLSGSANPALALWDRKKGRLAGLATARVSGRAAKLSILAIIPQYQGRGLGRIALAEILTRLSGRVTCLRVETASYNLPALKLCYNLGFAPAAPMASLHLRL